MSKDTTHMGKKSENQQITISGERDHSPKSPEADTSSLDQQPHRDV